MIEPPKISDGLEEAILKFVPWMDDVMGLWSEPIEGLGIPFFVVKKDNADQPLIVEEK